MINEQGRRHAHTHHHCYRKSHHHLVLTTFSYTSTSLDTSLPFNANNLQNTDKRSM